MCMSTKNGASMTSLVSVYGGIREDNGSYFFAQVMKNAEFPDQMIYEYDEEKDDNKINVRFFKELCAVFSDDGRGIFKVKTHDDYNNFEQIISLEEDEYAEYE